MFTDIRILIAELKKNPLATICGLLIGCVIWLVIHLVAVEKRHEAKDERNQAKIHELQVKVLDTERFWSDKVDVIRLEQIQEVRTALERQTKIEVEQKRLIKKVLK